MADMIKFIKGTKVQYSALTAEQIDKSAVYFLTDTETIMADGKEYGGLRVEHVTAVPEADAMVPNTIYIDDNSGYVCYVEGFDAEGTPIGHTISAPIAHTADEETQFLDDSIASCRAVREYVESKLLEGSISEVTYDQGTKTLSVTKNGETTETKLTGIVTGLTYVNGVLTASDVDGTAVSTLNLELERYLQDAYYDSDTASLVFEMKVEGSDDPTTISIPAGDFVTMMEGEDSGTVDVTISSVEGSANKIKADVKVSAEANNGLVAKADGLHVDTSNLMKMGGTDVANQVATFNAGGQVTGSGMTVGEDTFGNADSHATTLATEAGVADFVSVVTSGINQKLDKIEYIDSMDDYNPDSTKTQVTKASAVFEALAWSTIPTV